MAEGAVCVCLSLGWDSCGLAPGMGCAEDVGDSLLMARSTSSLSGCQSGHSDIF